MNASILPLRPDDAADSPEAIQFLLARGRERGRTAGIPYAGQVTPREAWRLHLSGAARLVDVRTRAEWEYVGHVEEVPLLEWRAHGAAAPDPAFVDKLAARFGRDAPLMLLCRSGVRSHHAATAAALAGFTRVYNVLEGFEGDQDEDGRRGTVGGWRHAGLPWTQT
jgi:rhodanese-related sulfurtransferase